MRLYQLGGLYIYESKHYGLDASAIGRMGLDPSCAMPFGEKWADVSVFVRRASQSFMSFFSTFHLSPAKADLVVINGNHAIYTGQPPGLAENLADQIEVAIRIPADWPARKSRRHHSRAFRQ